MQEKSNNEAQNNSTVDNAVGLLWTNSDWVVGLGVGLAIGTLIGLTFISCIISS
jgi:hypothetical protein